MKVLELFCGTKSISNAFKARGHKVYTVDWEKSFSPDLAVDIETLTVEQIKELCGGIPDVIWASPDCATYSVAAISYHRRKQANGSLEPITDYARKCDRVNKHLVDLINELQPKYWFIENPRAGLRKMDFMQGLPRYTVTYCKYGEKRQKPTDIWTNHPFPQFEPPCKNGDKCHEAAPRGSTTGTQGIKGAKDRARIPQLLCEHIVDICESEQSESGKTLFIDGEATIIYLCDRKAKCRNSKYCGTACQYTMDKRHEKKFEQVSIFDLTEV